jgi:PAS domain S-box-containing protein
MKTLSLKLKVILSTLIFVSIILGIQIFIAEQIFVSGYLKLEAKESIEALNRANVILNRQLDNMDIKVADWATWDDSYKFVQDKNQDFIDSNLDDLALETLDIDGIYYFSTPSALVYAKTMPGHIVDHSPIPQELESILTIKKGITFHPNEKSKKNGIIRLSEGLVFFASRPVIKSDGSGPVAGSIVFVRFLDPSLEQYFEKGSSTTINIYDYYSQSLPENAQKAKTNLVSKEVFENPLSENEVGSYSIIKDFDNKPAYILEVLTERDIFTQGRDAVHGFLAIFAFVAFISLFFAYFIINLFVLSKLSRLNKDVNNVSDPNNLQKRLDVKGSDEFTTLATNINKMLDQIGKSQEELEKFKLAIENTSDHIVITDPNGIVVYANKAAQRITGYTFDEMKGNTPRLWGRQMSKDFYETMWDMIKNKKLTFTGELTNRKKTGEKYPVFTNISPILDDNGAVKFFVGIERDITNEKKLSDNLLKQNEEIAEKVKLQTKEIKEEQDRLFKILESMPTGIFVLNSQGLPYYMNSEAKRLLGKGVVNVGIDELSQAYGVYKAGTNMLYPYDELPLVQAFHGRSASKKDLEIRQGDKKIMLEVTSAPIFDTEGKIIFSIAAFKDITEENILARSKDEFFSIASHELRTPLTAIRGNTALIKQYYQDKLKDNKDLTEMIDDIHDSSVRLIQIVNDFLNVSRLEQGKMEYSYENFDINELIKKKIDEVRSIASQKGIMIGLESPIEHIPHVHADKNRLSEVLLNLLGNAINYSEKGQITITVKVSGDFVKVYVADTGRGIPEEYKNLLFRKFQQASESILTRDTTKGTGLGLYISKLMIEQMGGEIHLESSEENKGSVFSFIVPVAK